MDDGGGKSENESSGQNCQDEKEEENCATRIPVGRFPKEENIF